jgi:oligoribonuclease NrnB/cAMP/cGMP phosphodiesterase (DHH superfamily)
MRRIAFATGGLTTVGYASHRLIGSDACLYRWFKSRSDPAPILIENHLRTDRPAEIDWVVYHRGCPDGIVGAWAFQKAYPDSQLIGWSHGDSLPEVSGAVAFVDISPSREQLDRLLTQESISKLYVLDHHRSAERALRDVRLAPEKGEIVFDMERSGCRLAWDFLFHSTEVPWWLLTVEAGDLWRHDGIENARPFLSAFHHFDYLSTVAGVERLSRGEVPREELLTVGKTIHQSRQQQVERYANRAVAMTLRMPSERGTTAAYRVHVVAAPSEIRSEVGHRVSEQQRCDFAVVQTFDPARDAFRLSLRANQHSPLDLSLIAQQAFGGGGHPKASGATLEREQWSKFFQLGPEAAT